jgi:hypothetical protein
VEDCNEKVFKIKNIPGYSINYLYRGRDILPNTKFMYATSTGYLKKLP